MAEVSNLWEVVQRWLDLQHFPPNQSALARALKVQRSAVSDWKTGKSRPSPEHLRELAKIMEPTLGPSTRDMLAIAIAKDLGYDVGITFDEPQSQRRNLSVAAYDAGDDDQEAGAPEED